MRVLTQHEFIYTFGVLANSKKKEQKLEQSSVVDKQHLTGIAIRRSSDTANTSNNNPIVSDAVFDSSFLTLKQRSVEVIEKLPLAIIEKFSSDGKWYEVDLPEIDMSQSSVLTSSANLIIDGEEFEFVFRFKKKIVKK
ncbi:MAG: hypothetical protein AAF789_12300 [Bacteroidota bacterium]